MKTFKICSVIFLFFTSTVFGKVFNPITFSAIPRQNGGNCTFSIEAEPYTISNVMCQFVRVFANHNIKVYFDTNFGIGIRPLEYKINSYSGELRSYFNNIVMTMPDDNCYASVVDHIGVFYIESQLMCFTIQKLMLSNKKEYITLSIDPLDIKHADKVQKIESNAIHLWNVVSKYDDFTLEKHTYVSVADIKAFGTDNDMKSFIVMNDIFYPFINNVKLYITNSDMFLRAVDYYLDKTVISVTIKRNYDLTYKVIKMVSLNDEVRDPRCEYDKRSKRNLEDQTMSMNDLMNLYTFSLHTQSVTRQPTNDNPVHTLMFMSVPMLDCTLTHVPLYMAATIYPDRVVSSPTSWSAGVERNIRNMGIRDNDERGHILARILGGDQGLFNVVPMVNSINRHLNGQLSNWRQNEEIMEGFLAARYGHVEYRVFIQYENLLLANDPLYQFSPSELRPTHFTQSFALVFNNGSFIEHGPMTFINDDAFECHDVYSSYY